MGARRQSAIIKQEKSNIMINTIQKITGVGRSDAEAIAVRWIIQDDHGTYRDAAVETGLPRASVFAAWLDSDYRMQSKAFRDAYEATKKHFSNP